MSNDAASIRKLENRLGGKHKVQNSVKKDGWGKLVDGLDKILDMDDSQDKAPPRKQTRKHGTEEQEPLAPTEPFDARSQAARVLFEEQGAYVAPPPPSRLPPARPEL